MKRLLILSLALTVLTWSALAQTSTQSQTSAGAAANANVSAGNGGVNAQSDTSVNASHAAKPQRSGDMKNDKHANDAASGDTSATTGTTLNAVLSKSIDSRKVKEGDEVVAKTTTDLKAEGQRSIPKGTKLIGHVTKATAKSKGDADSSLGVIFDRAEVAKGREVPIHAVIQALAATAVTASSGYDEPRPMANPSAAGGNAGGNAGGGLVGGTVGAVGSSASNTVGAVGNTAGGAVGATTGSVNNTTGNLGGAATSTLSSSARGVVGLPGYSLDTSATSAAQGSVITSTGKNVKLDSGTQMVLRVIAE